MPKLFVFAIGGTGSRILKSLTMLLASGYAPKGNWQFVPIVIDPDASAANMTEAETLLAHYAALRDIAIDKTRGNEEEDAAPEGTFFRSSISVGQEKMPDLHFMLQETSNKTFRDYIGYDAMRGDQNSPDPTYCLAQLLFSEKNLDASMEVGFKGNPNIGSVVLNQIPQNEQFARFAAAFKPGDRVFIISSIFGGTGASGFPLLLKNLRNINPNLPNAEAIRKAPIAGLSVHPYFQLEPSDFSAIDSSTFISKTKAALHYYENNLREINACYYIGTPPQNSPQYDNCDGGRKQRNRAHIVELIGATSIIDFCDQKASDLEVDGSGMAIRPMYFEFGLTAGDASDGAYTLASFPGGVHGEMQKALTQLHILAHFVLQESPKRRYRGYQWARRTKLKERMNRNEWKDLQAFAREYDTWIGELSALPAHLKGVQATEKRFQPFQLDDKASLANVLGVQPYNPSIGQRMKRGWATRGWNRFHSLMDIWATKHQRPKEKPAFYEILFRVTEQLANEALGTSVKY